MILLVDKKKELKPIWTAPPHFGQENVFFSWMASLSMCAYINVIIRSERMSEEWQVSLKALKQAFSVCVWVGE